MRNARATAKGEGDGNAAGGAQQPVAIGMIQLSG
jgi:hypothetical protein